MKLRVLALVLSLSLPCASQAQEVSAEMKGDIETLLEITGARAIGTQLGTAISGQMITQMRQVNPNFTDAQATIVTEVTSDFMNRFINDQSTTDAMVAVYAKHLNGDDIKQLIAFYSSPVGAKLTAAQPMIVQESMQASQQLMIQKWIPQLQQELMTRLQAAGAAPAAPPAQ